MGDITVWVVSVFATFLALILGYLYSRLPSMKNRQQPQDGVPPSVMEPLPVASAKEKQSPSVCKATQPSTPKSADDERTSASEHKTERWPIDGQGSTFSSAAKNPINNSLKDKVHDPMDYCGHIQREIKKTKHRLAMEKIEAEMTKEQKMEERMAQRRQLEEIFKLMENQKEFGLSSVDEIQDQVKLYVNI